MKSTAFTSHLAVTWFSEGETSPPTTAYYSEAKEKKLHKGRQLTFTR